MQHIFQYSEIFNALQGKIQVLKFSQQWGFKS